MVCRESERWLKKEAGTHVYTYTHTPGSEFRGNEMTVDGLRDDA